MPTRTPTRRKLRQQGVVLLETLIAILIFSMAVIAIIGVEAVMIKNTSDAKYRADASYIAQQRIGLMWADDTSNLSSYEELDADISSLLPSGTRTVARSGNVVTVTITWRLPEEPRHTFTTTASIVDSKG